MENNQEDLKPKFNNNFLDKNSTPLLENPIISSDPDDSLIKGLDNSNIIHLHSQILNVINSNANNESDKEN